MKLTDIDLDFNNAGIWPWPVKLGVIVIACVLLGGFWVYFDTQAQYEELETARQREQALRTEFEQKCAKAAHLSEYKAQMVELEKTLSDLLRQLPDKTQVPELLVDVSQTGVASGLEFELFKPGPEITRDFYAELPIEIRVVGNYVQFATFVSGLASLARIVTVHNVKISSATKDSGKKAGKSPLVMDAVVKTYRYLDDHTVGQDATAATTPPVR